MIRFLQCDKLELCIGAPNRIHTIFVLKFLETNLENFIFVCVFQNNNLENCNFNDLLRKKCMIIKRVESNEND